MTTKRRPEDGFNLVTPPRDPQEDATPAPATPKRKAPAGASGESLKPVTTRIPESLHKGIKRLALDLDVNTEALFAEAVADLLKKHARRG